MDIFGIGPLEAIFVVLIMLIVLGPTDMVKLGRTLGTNLRKLWTSPTWRMIFTASDTLRKLPTTLVREAGVEELRQELRRETESLKKMEKEISEASQIHLQKPQPSKPVADPNPGDFSAWTTPPSSPDNAETDPPNSILPPHLGKRTLPPTESETPPPGDSSPHTP